MSSHEVSSMSITPPLDNTELSAALSSGTTSSNALSHDQHRPTAARRLHVPSGNPSAGIPIAASATASLTASATTTITITETEPLEVLTLTLRARPSVTWDENVVDNEGLCRKSSKRCCIFHKQRAFGESSTDSSDYDSDKSGGSAASNGSGGHAARKKSGGRKSNKIARPKKNQVPDYQRFHA